MRDHPGPEAGQGGGPVRLYVAVRLGPGGQAQFLRVPQAQFGPVRVPPYGPDEQYLFLSDVLPTACQAVAYADTPKDGTLAVLGLGPTGQAHVKRWIDDLMPMVGDGSDPLGAVAARRFRSAGAELEAAAGLIASPFGPLNPVPEPTVRV